MDEKFELRDARFARLCYTRTDKKFVSVLVCNYTPSGEIKYEIRTVNGKKEFWIDAYERVESKLQFFIYPQTPLWEKFKPYRKKFLSAEDIGILEDHD